MRSRQRVADYAPFPLETDAASLGFGTTRVTREAGSITARHRPHATSARATLFLHGAAATWTTWTPLLRLHEFENPVVFDLPGWGDATPSADAPAITIDTICDLVRATAVELGYTEWDIVGHSMGGFIALHMATLWPGSVRSVRAISPTADSVVAAVAHPWAALRIIPGFVLFRAAMIAFAGIDRPARALVGFLARVRVLRAFVAPLFRHTRRVDPTIVLALGTELRPRSFVTATEVVRGYDTAAWDAIGCPIFTTRGDRDVFVTDDDLRGTASVIADCGHFGNVERPAEVLEALGYR